MNFNHFDNNGNAVMVDVSNKQITERKAIAIGRIRVNRECFEAVKFGIAKKGDVLGIARIAGIMGAKKTADIIPLCHILNLEKVSIEFLMIEDSLEIEVLCTVKLLGKTGVEMEAMMGASIALLTIYDMCKAIDKTMKIGSIYLVEKIGGKSGHFTQTNLKKIE